MFRPTVERPTWADSGSMLLDAKRFGYGRG